MFMHIMYILHNLHKWIYNFIYIILCSIIIIVIFSSHSIRNYNSTEEGKKGGLLESRSLNTDWATQQDPHFQNKLINRIISLVWWWIIMVVLATWEAEVGGSLESRAQGCNELWWCLCTPAWATEWDQSQKEKKKNLHSHCFTWLALKNKYIIITIIK